MTELDKKWKKKQEELENEDWVAKHPEADEIQCGDCVFRMPDSKQGDKVIIKGAAKGTCECYPKAKPSEVLWHGAECEYYVSEKEGEE